MATHPQAMRSARSSSPPAYSEDSTSDTIGESNEGARAATRSSARSGELSRGLGWFSIALGAAELLAPRQVAQAIGVNDDHASLLRLMGVREIASGVGLLMQPNNPAWLQARVAGDALDLALLGAAMSGTYADRSKIAGAAITVAGVTALDVMAARELSQQTGATDTVVTVLKSIAINRPAQELYDEWRKFEQLPRIMRHLESVQEIGDGRSHWIAHAPGGTVVEWDAEVIADEPAKLLAWRSLPDAEIENMGTIRFEEMPAKRGTMLRVELEYRPPGGKLGAAIAKLLGEEPAVQMQEDLRRFKQRMETGEVSTTRSQSSGTRSVLYRFISRKEPANES